MRSKAEELARLGMGRFDGDANKQQLSRMFIEHWENVERDAMDVFNRLLDVDEELVHRGANVDLSALHALIEEVRGCGASDICLPLDPDEFLVPKEISLLRRATFTSRLGELRMKPLKVKIEATPVRGQRVVVVDQDTHDGNGTPEMSGETRTVRREKEDEEEVENGEERDSCSSTPLTSPPPMSVKEEDEGDECVEDVSDTTPFTSFKTPHTTFGPKNPFEADETGDKVIPKSSTATTEMKKTLQFHTPEEEETMRHAKRTPHSSQRKRSQSKEAEAEAPCGASEEEEEEEEEEVEEEKRECEPGTLRGNDLEEEGTEDVSGGLPDGAAWEAEAEAEAAAAAAREELRREARVELWEDVRVLLLEEVKDIDSGVLDDISRRLKLQR